MINENELPKNWEVVKLGDVCQKISLNKIKIKQKDYLENGKYPVIDQGQELIGGYFDDENLIVPDEPPYIIFGDHTKVKKFINFRFIAGADGIKVLKPFRMYNAKFFFYLLFVVKIPDKGYARHFQFLEQAEIPLPPLAEQERIVAKIEELFSELDAGLESLKTAQAQLKTYRQAVLKYAFEGKLTNDKVNEGELPSSWKLEKLGNVIEQPKYGTSKKCDYNFEGFGVLRIPNIADGFIDATDLKFAEFDEKEIETYSLKDGDLLTIRSNGSVDLVGKCALIAKKDEQFLYAGYLIRLRPRAEKLNSKFLLNVLSSISLRNQIESKAKSTSGVNNINSDELKGLIIPLCSLEEQQRIVEEIESRLSVCDKLEETINASLKLAEALRQSILKKAFEGKLIKQSENDEPARVLLENIRKESEEFLKEEKIRKQNTPRISKSKNMAEELKEILQLLEEEGAPISAHTLWQSSIYKEDIDGFYAEIKKLIDKREIKEMPREGQESYLALASTK